MCNGCSDGSSLYRQCLAAFTSEEGRILLCQVWMSCFGNRARDFAPGLRNASSDSGAFIGGVDVAHGVVATGSRGCGGLLLSHESDRSSHGGCEESVVRNGIRQTSNVGDDGSRNGDSAESLGSQHGSGVCGDCGSVARDLDSFVEGTETQGAGAVDSLETGNGGEVFGDVRYVSGSPLSTGVSAAPKAFSRGKNWRRNSRKRRNKKSNSEGRLGSEDDNNCLRRESDERLRFSVFERCSDAVKERLRDSRAQMFIKQNELAVIKAEADRRRTEALLKSQVIERDVENKRLKLDSEFDLAVLEKKKTIGPGFAETLITEQLESVCSVPSLSSGSVSPNSSISVAELNRLTESLSRMAEDRFELRRSVLAKDEELSSLKRRLEDLTVSRNYSSGNGDNINRVKIHGGNGFSSWSC